MKKIDTVMAFPTPIQVYRYEHSLEKEIRYIENLEWMENTSNFVSKENYLLDRNVFSSITSFFKECLDDFCDTILNSDQRLVITQSWGTKNEEGCQHPNHSHKNSIVSGAFYLRQTPIGTQMQFTNPNLPAFGLQDRDANCFTAQSIRLPCETGDLVLFPSSIWHSVPVNKSNEKRLSMSFNTFCTDVMGNKGNMTYLDRYDKNN
jgi:uncharacterized protein (TIGR02466 family)